MRDPSAIHSQLHRNKGDGVTKDNKGVRISSSPGTLSLPPRSLGKRASIAALPSLVRDSWSWAGDTLNSLRDGLSREEREEKQRKEDRKQVLYLKIRNAISYDEWRKLACELDELEGNSAWKESFESDIYNPELVRERLQELEEARISCDVSRMLFLVRTALSRDLGNMSDSRLYRYAHVGTKNLIDQYITTAVDTISTLVDLSGSDRCDPAEMQYILDQILSARQAFGRSAMLFSGGATFGMNHVGVLKALWEAKLVPRIISGASAGSIVTAVFCVHTDDELPEVLARFGYGDLNVFEPEGEKESPMYKAARFLKHGYIFDIRHLQRVMRDWLGDITFQEAYNRTRRILNICISSAGLYELPRLLNYITAPNVMIWSAVGVSCSVPIVFSPAILMAKDPLTGEAVPWHDDRRQWIDGSVDGDIPMTRLAEMFNVNHFIVSQVNPHVVPFVAKDDGVLTDPNQRAWLGSKWLSSPWVETLTSLAREEALHRMAVLSELGIFSNELNKAASILSQKYSGNINIFPEIPYANFAQILQNPTTDFMLQACLSGERATWPKIGRIRNHVAIELALDSAAQTLRARVALNPRLTGWGLQPNENGARGSSESGRGRRRSMHQRRSSYTNELGSHQTARSTSNRHSVGNLRKANSSHGIEGIFSDRLFSPMIPIDPKVRTMKVPATNDTDHPAFFTVVSDSEDDTESVRRPRSPGHSATWAPMTAASSSPSAIRQNPSKSRSPSLSKSTPLLMSPLTSAAMNPATKQI